MLGRTHCNTSVTPLPPRIRRIRGEARSARLGARKRAARRAPSQAKYRLIALVGDCEAAPRLRRCARATTAPHARKGTAREQGPVRRAHRPSRATGRLLFSPRRAHRTGLRGRPLARSTAASLGRCFWLSVLPIFLIWIKLCSPMVPEPPARPDVNASRAWTVAARIWRRGTCLGRSRFESAPSRGRAVRPRPPPHRR